jgi:hypothetical protein
MLYSPLLFMKSLIIRSIIFVFLSFLFLIILIPLFVISSHHGLHHLISSHPISSYLFYLLSPLLVSFAYTYLIPYHLISSYLSSPIILSHLISHPLSSYLISSLIPYHLISSHLSSPISLTKGFKTPKVALRGGASYSSYVRTHSTLLAECFLAGTVFVFLTYRIFASRFKIQRYFKKIKGEEEK